MLRRLPFGSIEHYNPVVYDGSDPSVLRAALAYRLFSEVPEPEVAILRRFGRYVRKQLARHVDCVDPLDFDQYLAGTKYSLRIKDDLRRAHDSLGGGLPLIDALREYGPFVKAESYPMGGDGVTKAPRAILAPSLTMKAFAGPFIKAIENEVYKLPWFAKHLTMDEKIQRVIGLRDRFQHYYATDFSKFEASFSPQFQKLCENQLFRHALRNYPLVANLLCRVNAGKKILKARNGLRTHFVGRRCSGDLWTSLANGFSNLMLVSFAVSQTGGDWDGIFEGDDGLFGTETPINESLLTSLGFVVKLEQVIDPCRASFCGLVFGPSLQVIREPYRFLQKFGWTFSYVHSNEKMMLRLLRAKALSAVYETPHCPIVGVLAREALLFTRGYLPKWVEDGFHEFPSDEVEIPRFEPTADTRLLFAELYGIDIDLQLCMEDLIRQRRMSDFSRLLDLPGANFGSTCLQVE
jgi:hypothetical protein